MWKWAFNWEGRFTYDCTATLLYVAKSRKAIGIQINDIGRDEYLTNQQTLKNKGLSYDHAAPPLSASKSVAEAYWTKVSSEAIQKLRAANTFGIRWQGMSSTDSNGKLAVQINFLGSATGQTVKLVTKPAKMPISLSDKKLEAEMRANATRANTEMGVAKLLCRSKL